MDCDNLTVFCTVLAHLYGQEKKPRFINNYYPAVPIRYEVSDRTLSICQRYLKSILSDQSGEYNDYHCDWSSPFLFPFLDLGFSVPSHPLPGPLYPLFWSTELIFLEAFSVCARLTYFIDIFQNNIIKRTYTCNILIYIDLWQSIPFRVFAFVCS